MQNINILIRDYLSNEIYDLKKLEFQKFSIQLVEEIRKKYGKANPPKSKRIGVHPDYQTLTDKIQEGHAITLFADIANSTRMSANLPPKTVLIIKKTILSIFSQVVIALDGHVHRLQGDAIMAFFNWNDMKHSQSCWNAIFAAMEILNIVQDVLSDFIANEIITYKKLNKDAKVANNIAVRIGIDYGTSESILWAKLGIQNNFKNIKIYEHTATGLNVDLASKIQNKVGRNKIGLGENVYIKIGLDESYLAIHEKNNEKKYYIIENPHYSYRILKNDKLLNDLHNYIHDARKFTS